MIECGRTGELITFGNRDHVRYRGLLHDLDSPCPQWDQAMQGGEDMPAPRFFVDRLERIQLVAEVTGGLRAEGVFRNVSSRNFISWCRRFSPRSADTTHEEIKDAFSEAFGIQHWGMNGTYSVASGGFVEKISHPVRQLTSDDRPMWRPFVQTNEDDPMVSEDLGSGAVVRDFEFMCAGLPVDYYATIESGDITGMVSVNPMTDRCDEVSAVFVSPAHRGRGLATSLLSMATRDILERGKRAAYSAAGNSEDVVGLVRKVGYSFIAFWWYWWA